MATLRATSKITDRFSVDAKVSYTRQDGKNRPQTSGSPSNVFAQYVTMPRSIHISDMNPWKDSQGGMVLWKPASYSTLRNPYWTMFEDFNRDGTDRMLTMVKLEYKITDWLKVHLRNGIDHRSTFYESANAYGIRDTNFGTLNFNSGYNANTEIASETNTDILFTASKTFNDLNVSLSAGGNERNTNYSNVGGNTNVFDFPPVYTLGTGSNPRPYSSKSQLRVNSLYAFVNLSYKNYLFLDATYRNDWTSTLSPQNRSIGYPSVSASAVLSEMIAAMPSAISFAKIRGGFAQTGGFIDPYSLYPTFTIGKGFNNAYSTGVPTTAFDPNILPEKVNSFELGLDLKFWSNRIGLEVAYYSRNITNQIVKIPQQGVGQSLPGGKFINAGDVQNQGIEFVLTATPVKNSLFNWDAAINFNHNVNTVKQLTPELSRFMLADDASSRAVRFVADVDRPMGDIYGRDFVYDDQHRLLVDANGVPKKATDKNTLLGNYQPQFTLGFVNNFSYKNFSLGILLDWRQGGKIFSQSQAYMYAAGTAEGTLANRDGGLIVSGVHDDGTPNTTAINAQTYWSSVAGSEPVASQFIYDASSVRVRELTLTYNFPTRIFERLPINRLSLSAVGRNVFMISSSIPGIDPESTFNVTNAQGYENGSYPSYRSIGFNFIVGF